MASVILPGTGFVRLQQIIGDPKANPPIPPIIPIGRSSWWAGVKSGRYPKAHKLGPRTTVWKVEDIRALIEAAANRPGAA
jgi:prophage regulatory protein